MQCVNVPMFVQVGIFPGQMAKICPHTSTGRADYFGPAVNRAARLLCAAKGGQILVGHTHCHANCTFQQHSQLPVQPINRSLLYQASTPSVCTNVSL